MRHKNLFRKVLSVALATSLTLSNYSGVIASDVYATESEVVESENINEEDPVVDYDYVNETGSEDLGIEPQSSESTESGSDQGQGNVNEEPTEVVTEVPEEGNTEDSSNQEQDSGFESNEGAVIEPETPTEKIPSDESGFESDGTVLEPETPTENEGTETTTEGEVEEGSTILEEVKGNVKIKVRRKDGTEFPKGTYLNIKTIDEMVSEEDDPEEVKDLYLGMMKATAVEKYAEKYISNHSDIEWTDDLVEHLKQDYVNVFKMFNVYQIDILNEDDSLYTSEASEFYVSFELTDSNLLSALKSGTDWMDVIPFDENLQASPLMEGKVSVGSDDSNNLVVVDSDNDRLYPVYSLVQLDETWSFDGSKYSDIVINIGGVDVKCTCDLSSSDSEVSEEDKQNPWKHDWNCDIFKAQVYETCDCEFKEDTSLDVLYHDSECAAAMAVIKEKCTCGYADSHGDLNILPDEHSSDCEIYKHYMEIITSDTDAYWSNSGTQIKGSAGQTIAGYRVVNKYSSELMGLSGYTGIRRYAGYTTMSTWINGNQSSVKAYETTASDGTVYKGFITNGTGAQGNFGFDLRHIAIKNNRWVNARVTVSHLGQMVYTSDDPGSSRVKFTPVIAIKCNNSGNDIQFKNRGARIELTFNFTYDDGSTATGNYMASLNGVNAGQNFALSTTGMSKRYTLPNNEIYVQSMTYFGTSYLNVTGPHGDWSSNANYAASAQGRTLYYYDNISSFKYCISPAGQADVSHPGQKDSTYKVKKGADAAKSIFNGSTAITPGFFGIGVTSWISGAQWAATNPSIGEAVSTSNTDTYTTTLPLSSDTQSFYYNMVLNVYDVPDITYGFNWLNVKKSLPAGVDYANGFYVTRVTDGGNATGSFTISNSNDYITVSATSNALTDSNFYGDTYIISIKVTADPTEISSSSITYSGNAFSYAFNSSCYLECQLKNVNNAALNYDVYSNTTTVSYYGTKNRVTAEKYIYVADQPEWKKSWDLSSSGDVTYLIAVNVPANARAGYMNKFEVNDVLESGITIANHNHTIYGNWPTDASGKFTVTYPSNNKITISATPTALDSADFYGKTYLFIFNAHVDTSSKTGTVSGNDVIYSFNNNAYVTSRHKGDGNDSTLTTNSVTINVKETRTNPGIPEKYVWNEGSSKWDSSVEFNTSEIKAAYLVRQWLPAYTKSWYASSFSFSDTIPDCFDIQEVKINMNGEGYVNFPSPGRYASYGWDYAKSGQKITMTAYNGFNANRYGGYVDLYIAVKMKDGYDLSKWYNATTGKVEIPNTANATFNWGKGSPTSVTQNSRSVTIKVSESKATVKVSKLSKDTNEVIPDATFVIQEWNGSSYVAYCNMSYSQKDKLYVSNKELVRNTTNQGKFKIVESVVPDGYRKNASYSQEIVVPNKPGTVSELNYTAYNVIPKGYITVWKWDAVDAKVTPDEYDHPLGGAEYTVKALDNIYSPEGKLLVKKDDVVSSLITNDDGNATTDALYLGKYYIEETKPPMGYVLDKSKAIVKVQQDDSIENVDFFNTKTRVTITKLSELVNGESSNEKLSGVQFKIWNKENGVNSAVVKTTDTKGNIVLSGYVDGTYCYQEVSPLDGYVVDNTVREFTIDENGYVNGKDKAVLEVKNKVIKAEFQKVDNVTGLPIAGAELELQDKDGKVVESWTSDTTPHRINRLKAGTYTLIETKAPNGYKKAKPIKCTVVNTTSYVQLFAMGDTKYVDITISKFINRKEVVPQHGTPTFIFKVEGTDLDGDAHTYYRCVSFDNIPESGTYVPITTVISAPAGKYTITEVKTSRYYVEEIEGAVSGNVVSGISTVDTSTNAPANVNYYNKKSTDEYLTDTDVVVNHVVG